MTFVLFVVFLSVSMVGFFVVPIIYSRTVIFSQKRQQYFSHKLDRVMPRQQIQKVTKIYILAPILLAVFFAIVFPAQVRVLGIVLGVIGGFFFPGLYTKILIAQNKKKFADQMVDALMIMSSSFRGGLSLIQAMESVVEEMPEPMAQELSTVLAENNMGVSLEEALAHLYHRQPSPAVQQMTTAILLARETGGNLPVIFQRIVSVLRQRKRIEGQIATLTIQGKIQGVVMSLLPIMFIFVVYGSNPEYFNHMMASSLGRKMLIYACISEILGAYMIIRISMIKDF